jgi:YidC/Oxa1 family membrane protein insertase
MDKRLSLALLLTALVVAVTPILFPTPRRTPATTAAADSLRDSVSGGPAVNSVAPQAAAAPVVTAVTDSSVQSTGPTVVSPEITSISTPRSTYQFSNIGAVPVSVEFPEYRKLVPGQTGNVELAVPGEGLLEFALAIPGDTLSLGRIPFQLERGESSLTYRAAVAGRTVTVSYSLVPDRYVVKVAGRVDGGTGASFLLISLPSTLPATEADTVGDLRTLAYSFKTTRDNAEGVPFGKLDPGEVQLEPGPLTWVAVRNKYFVVGIVNPEGSTFEEVTLTGGPRVAKTATRADATAVKALRDGTFAFDLYIGPQQSTELAAMGRDFDHVNPYGWSFLQPVVNPIAALCIKLLLWMHETLALSYGWVLVIFGVVIRIALWPLNQGAMRSSLKMQEIQPQLAEVQKKYKDKPEKQREEMMRVYREAGASPFTALSGCLPMLIPMPVLFALFFVFQNTIEFRGVPFLWLNDISVKDPYYILPVLMGASMYVLSWIGLRNAPPNPQAKMMMYMFPVMMTFVLANMASGLNLYYTSQNIAALPQQWLLARERLKARQKK